MGLSVRPSSTVTVGVERVIGDAHGQLAHEDRKCQQREPLRKLSPAAAPRPTISTVTTIVGPGWEDAHSATGSF